MRLTTVRHTHDLDDAGLSVLRSPRNDIVAEVETAPDVFGVSVGPTEHYERRLVVEKTPNGRHRVSEETTFRLAVPVWRPLMTFAARTALARRAKRPEADGSPWWAPPDVFSARSAVVLSLLCSLAIITSYLGTLLSQTITFAAEQFDAPDSRQGVTLSAVRVGVLVALAASGLADRHGRRRVLLIAVAGACALTAATALAPSLLWYGVAQTASRGLSAAAAILIGIVAAEELPAGSRAYGVSVLALSAGLGSGMVIWFLPLADLDPGGWRLLFLIPLLGLPATWWIGRRLPETHRFDLTTAPDRPSAAVAMPWRRLLLLAGGSYLGLVFLAPASQFANEYLRDDHGFTATDITIFSLVTGTPATLGVIIGGRLADVRGRRPVGSAALLGGVALSVVTYLGGGAVLWVAATLGSIVGGAAAPALGVYGPEMFPTERRGLANGIISVIGVCGSVTGLLVAGFLSDRLGGLGTPIALLAVGPVIWVVLILRFYPETANRELEDINATGGIGS